MGEARGRVNLSSPEHGPGLKGKDQSTFNLRDYTNSSNPQFRQGNRQMNKEEFFQDLRRQAQIAKSKLQIAPSSNLHPDVELDNYGNLSVNLGTLNGSGNTLAVKFVPNVQGGLTPRIFEVSGFNAIDRTDQVRILVALGYFSLTYRKLVDFNDNAGNLNFR